MISVLKGLPEIKSPELPNGGWVKAHSLSRGIIEACIVVNDYNDWHWVDESFNIVNDIDEWEDM